MTKVSSLDPWAAARFINEGAIAWLVARETLTAVGLCLKTLNR